MLNQLFQLVRSFSEGEQNYAHFRPRFVREFLALHHDDGAVERLVNAIEGACADFDEGDLGSVSDLREELIAIINSPQISIEVVDANGALSRTVVSQSGSKRESGSDAFWGEDYAMTA